MGYKETLCITMDPDLIKALYRLYEKNRDRYRSISAMVREAVERYVASEGGWELLSESEDSELDGMLLEGREVTYGRKDYTFRDFTVNGCAVFVYRRSKLRGASKEFLDRHAEVVRGDDGREYYVLVAENMSFKAPSNPDYVVANDRIVIYNIKAVSRGWLKKTYIRLCHGIA
ncbi:MAG: CopG family transcriptional regulator [Pyrobaculum sp.]